ncbi:MAG: hypothetical protein SPF74_07875 [Candidatus Limivicinus sp.]|nr:hypothetical protein [Oscillospiraceae bacterium]MDY5565122.1 hypothetical protein [Candidatus Limivicinus sp.]
MQKFLKKLAKLVLFLLVAAVAGCVFFYFKRKEHFHSVSDFVEELLGTLSEVAFIALFIP